MPLDPAISLASESAVDEALRQYCQAIRERAKAWDNDDFPAYKRAHMKMLQLKREWEVMKANG